MESKNLPRARENLPTHTRAIISIGATKKKVLRLLSEGGNAHSISRRIGRRRSTIIQHLQELENYGLTIKEGYLWKATPIGIGYLGGRFPLAMCERKGVGTTDWLQDRAHNIKIKFPVLTKPNYNWAGWKANDKIKNNVFYTRRFGEIVTTYTGASFIFQLPMLRFKDSETAIAEAGRIGIELARKYELEIYGLRLGEPNVKAQLISQHHAVPNEPYAKFLAKHGISYRDEMIDFDASKGSPELEFTDKEKSHLHHKHYINFVKDFSKQEVPKMSDIAKMLSKTETEILSTQKQIQVLAQAQLNTTLNLKNVIDLLKPAEHKTVEKLGEKPSYFG